MAAQGCGGALGRRDTHGGDLDTSRPPCCTFRESISASERGVVVAAGAVDGARREGGAGGTAGSKSGQKRQAPGLEPVLTVCWVTCSVDHAVPNHYPSSSLFMVPAGWRWGCFSTTHDSKVTTASPFLLRPWQILAGLKGGMY